MSIKRAPREKTPFTIVNNGVFEAGNLSFPAMGFLCYLISKPDHWEISIPNCIQVTQGTRKPFGRDAIYALIDELISAGYIDRIDTRGADGRRTGVDYVVYDRPEGTRSKPVSSSVSGHQLPPEPEVVQPNPVEADYLVKTDSKKGLNTPIIPKPKSKAPSVEIPEWVPSEAWNGFLEMRKKIKKPLTERGVALALKKLGQLRDEGHDPSAVLDQSVMSNYQGLFPVKGDFRSGTGHRRQTAADLAEQNAIRMKERMGMNR